MLHVRLKHVDEGIVFFQSRTFGEGLWDVPERLVSGCPRESTCDKEVGQLPVSPRLCQRAFDWSINGLVTSACHNTDITQIRIGTMRTASFV